MEVTRDDFERDDSKLLKDIIKAISSAQFVALDLEFSGVLRKANSLGRKQNIRERYLQLKEGAERYQVLQVGLCAVEYDEQGESYVCRPYTFPLSPVTDHKWNMDREYTYQASAIQFLSDNKFDFNVLFRDGIPYLNHEEEKYVRDREERAIGGVMEDITIEESQKDFLKKVVEKVQKWVDDPDPEYDFVNITGPGNEINGYQKRLVHQVVRGKFPNLVTLSRNKFIQVIKRDEDQEAMYKKEKTERSQEKIQRGVGLRHVIDAMRERGVPLVGHNLFGDLIHFYRTFVGTLPDTLEGFSEMVNADFPVVCDTKYIATCEGACLGAASNLQILSETLDVLQNPPVSIHMDHQVGLSAHHNAGYDSLVTAKVLLKLINNYQNHLEKEGTGTEADLQARKNMVGFINQMRHYDVDNIPILDANFMLPSFKSYQWNGFKNFLRVNGTEEGIVVLEKVGGAKLGDMS